MVRVRVSGTDSMGHGGTAGHVDTMSRKTAKQKPTTLYCPSEKRSPKRLIVLVEPKKWMGMINKFPARSAGHVLPILNSFRRHWLGWGLD